MAYEPQDVSFEDLRSVNMEILRLRRLQAKIGEALGQMGRDVTTAELDYDRAFRRAVLRQSGGSEGSRKAAAQLECEELEGVLAVRRRAYENLLQRFRSVRDDQGVLENLSSNIRSTMRL
jgi:hypothetical protein